VSAADAASVKTLAEAMISSATGIIALILYSITAIGGPTWSVRSIHWEKVSA
jgi:hypothetical protein